MDFGNSEVKRIADIQPLPSRFTKPEAQATRVTLYNIASSNPTLLAKEIRAITQDVLLICVAISTTGTNCFYEYYIGILFRNLGQTIFCDSVDGC